MFISSWLSLTGGCIFITAHSGSPKTFDLRVQYKQFWERSGGVENKVDSRRKPKTELTWGAGINSPYVVFYICNKTKSQTGAIRDRSRANMLHISSGLYPYSNTWLKLCDIRLFEQANSCKSIQIQIF